MNQLISRMKRHARLVLWAFALMILLCLGVRVLWLASRTETGFCMLRQQWGDATAGWFQSNRRPIYMREPSEQAEFWLREVDRVLKAHPNDARLAMGAALVLDAPNEQYGMRYSKHGMILGTTFPVFDFKPIERFEDVFEKQCRQRCLELAARATQLEENNVEWWRLRALLLFRGSIFLSHPHPRDPHWLDILDECRRHDPGNALYDYLAAKYYWDTGAKRAFTTDSRLVVKDAAKYQEGIEWFERGQAKPHCSVGDVSFTATDEFLIKSNVPMTAYPLVVGGQKFRMQDDFLFYHLYGWQEYRDLEKYYAGDIHAALAMVRQNLHLCGQFCDGGQSVLNDLVIEYKVRATKNMKLLANERKDTLSAAEIEQIEQLREFAIIEKMIHDTADRALAKKQNRSPTGVTSSLDFLTLISAFMVAILPSLIVLLLFVGIVATLLGRRLSKEDVPVVGPIGQSLTFLAALAISFVFFGLAPAEIISRNIQSWFFSIGLLSLPLLAAFWGGWMWLKKRAYQFSIRALLIAMAILYLAFGLVSAVSALVEFPFRLWIPPRDWDGIDVTMLGPEIKRLGEWCWAAWQWIAYRDGYIALAIWAVLIVVCYAWKIRHRQRRPDAIPLSGRKRLAGLVRSLSRPAFAASAIMLMIYLLLSPGYLEWTELDFQEEIAFARNPEKHWAEVRQCVEEIRADEATMRSIRESAKEFLATESDAEKKK